MTQGEPSRLANVLSNAIVNARFSRRQAAASPGVVRQTLDRWFANTMKFTKPLVPDVRKRALLAALVDHQHPGSRSSGESYLVAELLPRMEQQSSALRPLIVDLVTNLNTDEFPEALETSIDMLGQAIDEPVVHQRARNWFSGRFQSVVDMTAFVRDRIAQAHAIWMPYRRDQRELPGITTAQRTNVYRTMIQVADCTLRDLLREQELSRFLVRGAAANDLPDVHLRCKRIVHMLRAEIDIDPASRFAHKLRRLAQDGREAEQ